jgi:hypothetical protein
MARTSHGREEKKKKGGPVGGADMWGPAVRGRGREWQVGPAAIQVKFEIIQILSNLVRIKTSLPELENFEIKYAFGGFEEMNNFLHRNFIRFEMNFEVKFWEVKVCF